MVLSRRVVVLVAMVAMVVVALSIIGVLGAVGSASPNNNPNAKARTLTVVTKTREIEVVDLEPPGPTHGDLRVVNAPLYNASGTEKIGRFDASCVTPDPADEPAEKANMAECTRACRHLADSQAWLELLPDAADSG